MPHQIQNPDEITVLIPAAGRVPEGLLALSNITCTALIPVAGRPVVYWTLTYLRQLGLRRFRIAVPQRGLFVEDFVECTAGKDCDVKFIVPASGPAGGLGETVAALLDFVETKSALVVLGDTYFQFDNPSVLNNNEAVVLSGPVEESYRWCVVESDATGHVSRLLDKQKNLQPPLDALIGVYFFPDAVAVRRTAREAVGTGSGKIELISILNRMMSQAPIRTCRAGEWLDCGNPDRQAGSHVALLQKREFNELSIDRTVSTITKRSRMKDKFFAEINYMRLLPNDLAVLFPRVVDYSLNWDDLSITLEYYGYATLAEMFIYENMDPGVWHRIFSHLFKILTTVFTKYRQPLEAEAILDMYLHKPSKRMAEMKGSAELLALRNATGPITINGRSCPSMAMIWPRVEQEVRQLSVGCEGAVVHGDLCFSNILYDVRSQICKFVDPRGSFGKRGIIGDLRYDVAKLYHSVLGLYDFITNDLFDLSVRGTDVSMNIRTRPQHRQILDAFERVFFPTFDRREILLLTALIFASIPALHYDKPQRQIAMYAKSLEMFAELYPLDEESAKPQTPQASRA